MGFNKSINLAYSLLKANKVILYPCGDDGIVIKSFLNTLLNIKEYAIIDERLSKNNCEVYSIDNLKSISDYDKSIYIITSKAQFFSVTLIENGISPARIVNPFVSEKSMIIDCLIYILIWGEYRTICDPFGFLYDNGQISKSFYSTIENKYYLFTDKKFVSHGVKEDFPVFKYLYSNTKDIDINMVFVNWETPASRITDIDNLIRNSGCGLICISVKEIVFGEEPNRVFKYSYLYVYVWGDSSKLENNMEGDR